MITCNLHGRSYLQRACPLSDRAAEALIHAQRSGDSVAIVLFDREVSDHRCLATIGLSRETSAWLAEALIDCPAGRMSKDDEEQAP